MRYALLQTDSAQPTPNQLKRAFRAVPDLRDLDAVTSAKERRGIIMRGLSGEQADRLQEALHHEDVAVEPVNESELPVLPLGRAVRSIQFEPAHFLATDPLGRTVEVPWSEVLILAAGELAPSPLERPWPAGGGHESNEGNQHSESAHLAADVLLRGGSQRYSIEVDQFDFKYLGQRCTNALVQNLAYLIQDLVQFAPGAGLNRGAYQFCDQPAQAVSYPGKSAYLDELVWMMWLSGQAGG